MKIVFICGSLESGKDGVGDYVQHLCEELIRQDHQVLAIAINDRYIISEFEGEHDLNGIRIQVLRLPSTLTHKIRFLRVKSIIKQFSPEYISLQFVPYSFQNKGLPYRLKSFVGIVGRDYQWHIMFHELWLGFSINSPLKDKVIGFFQHNIIMSLLSFMKPTLVNTSNLLYKRLLEKNHIPCVILPLFSNIPVAPRDEVYIGTVLKLLGIERSELQNWKIIGIFGNIYPDSNLAEAMVRQLELEKSNGMRMACIGIGNVNEYGMGEFRKLENLFGESMRFIHLGAQSKTIISNVLQILDYGISCTPADHIGKSGVFATMKLHGLKVILPEQVLFDENDREIVDYNSSLMTMPPETWKVSYVADQFVEMLKKHNVVFKQKVELEN